jgi:adenine deaminase
MTAKGDLLDELHVAHRSASAERLFEMVTSEPARILRLPDGFGRISHGGPADLLVVEDDGKTPASALLTKYPQLVFMGGRVVLASAAFARNNAGVLDSSLFALGLEGRGRYWIAANIPTLVRRTKERLNEDLHLAGKAIAV